MNKKKVSRFVLGMMLSSTLLVGCAGGARQNAAKNEDPGKEPSKPGETVTVLAAASMTDAVNELISSYVKSHPEDPVVVSYGGSGALQSQIEEGAPADIFLSAGEKQMDALEEGGHLIEGSRRDLVKNEVVLVAPKDSALNLSSFEDVMKDEVKKIAIADPSSVPVGQYSEEIFTSLGLWEKLQVSGKMVMSQDVRQSLDWTAQGEVDLATVYATDAATEPEKVKVITKAPEGSHKPITYPIARIKGFGEDESAKAFYDYLTSDEAFAVYEKYGFERP